MARIFDVWGDAVRHDTVETFFESGETFLVNGDNDLFGRFILGYLGWFWLLVVMPGDFDLPSSDALFDGGGDDIGFDLSEVGNWFLVVVDDLPEGNEVGGISTRFDFLERFRM